MAVRFAYVKYISDNVKAIVPIGDIKHFYPEDDTDFVKSKAYRVLWQNDNDDDEGDYYKAQVLLLGSTEESLEKVIQASRVKVPKLLDTSVEETTDDESESTSSEKMLKATRTERKIQKQSKASAQRFTLDAILQEKLGTKKRTPLCPENQDEVLEQTWKHKYEEVKAEKIKLLSELEEYRKLNRKLQKALYSKLFGEHNPLNQQLGSSTHLNQEKPPAAVQEKEKETSLQTEDGEVDLGGGVVIDSSKWEHLSRLSKPSIFAKSLVVAVWGSETLMNRSIEGKVCPRFAKDGREARQALTPKKYDAVKERYLQFLKEKGISGKEEKLLNKYINEKISDINRAAKRKLDLD